jgi:phenylalanyl-tRNA synthetase beta chain
LIRLVQVNWDNHVENVRLFEIGTIFAAGAPGERPGEERHVAAVLTGRREPPHWTGTGESRLDLWDLKGQFEVAVGLAIPGGAVQLEGNGWVARDSNGRTMGQAGLLKADAPPWAAPLYGYELVLDPAPRLPTRFAALPSTPASERVLALLLPKGVSVVQVEELLRKSGGPLLESVTIESDYRGSELPPGTRSVAFRVTFRAPDRTLRDTETDTIEARMLAALAAELGIQRRVTSVSGGGESA